MLALAGLAGMGSSFGRPTEPPISEPPESLKVDPFYKKHASAAGLPIVSSESVADAALLKAKELIDRMLADRPDIRDAMVKAAVRFVVIGADEQVTDIPEYSNMKPKEFWNQRARGFGGRVVSCGEENLLCYPIDRYDDENILVHELAHCIHGIGLRRVDSRFDERLRRLYENARAKGLWKGTYAGSNAAEYWAEAVQSYFDTNRQNNYNHNHVNTREELRAYDPELCRLVAETFRHTDKTDWRYKPVAAQPRVTSPPPALNCDPFYKKYVYARGLPVLGPDRVSDEALLEANYLVRQVFAYRHDVLKAMIDAGLRIVVVDAGGNAARVPEWPDAGAAADPQNVRFGYLPQRNVIVCAEQNLLCSPEDAHAGESTLIRDLAIAMHKMTGHRPVTEEPDKGPRQQYELGLKRIDAQFDEKLRQLHKAASEKGLWKDTFAGANCEEYWAEALQSWFDANLQDCTGHNHVNTRAELTAYDPDLARFVADVFRHSFRTDWRYTRPADRK
jgi:hypothetical protein